MNESTLPRELAPLPEAVTSFGAAVNDGCLYVFGGHRGERHQYSADLVSGSLHRLRLTQGSTWERLASAEPAQGTALVAHRHFLYRVGGMAARNAAGQKSDLYSTASISRYDVRRRLWEEYTPLPDARSSHDATVLGDVLFVGGGWRLSGAAGKADWHDVVLSLDLRHPDASWRAFPQPFERRGLALAGLGTRLYFLGGMTPTNGTCLEVDVLDTASGKWSTGPLLPDGPMKGFGCSATTQNGRIYYSGMKGEVYQLSAPGDAWVAVGTLRHPRFFHRLVPAGAHHLLAAGGEDSGGKLNSLELLAPSLTATADHRPSSDPAGRP
jgi:hypothetical protein